MLALSLSISWILNDSFLNFYFQFFTASIHKYNLLLYIDFVFWDLAKQAHIFFLAAFLQNLWYFLHKLSNLLWIKNYFFFPMCMPFISFTCLIALARSSSVEVNRSETAHLALFPALGGSCLFCSILYTQHPAPCLAHSRHSKEVAEWIKTKLIDLYRD